LMSRVHRAITFGMAFFEALAFALTISLVVAHLDNVWNLMAYSLGYAIGTIIGMWIEQRLAAGYSTINIVSVGKSLPIATAIRAAGFGATRSSGEGSSGTVGLVRVVARRRNIDRLVKLVLEVDPKAFVTTEDTRHISRGILDAGGQT